MTTLTVKNKYHAPVTYDHEIGMYRGEFITLQGGVDFYATTLDELQREGATSLEMFLEECKAHEMLIQKLVDGEKSAQEKGWIPFEDVVEKT